MWVFDQTAFDAFLVAGGTASELDAYAITKAVATESSWGSPQVVAGDLLHLVSTNGTATFDEYRSATTLGEVLPVPEPTLAGGLGACSAGLLVRRRRRRA
jgi:hypothetical protein